MFFNINCKECGGLLVFDERATSTEYNMLTDYLFEDIEKIADSSIASYLVFTCRRCGKKEQITYKDWEERTRKEIIYNVMNIRTINLLARFRGKHVDEAKGTSFCGKCFGYGGDGWCLNDIMEKCDMSQRG